MSSAEADVAAIIVAGGSGSRMGLPEGHRKQYIEIAGVPVLRWALEPFLGHPAIAQVIVALPAEDVESPPAWLVATGVTLVAGGATRMDSVRNGLDALVPTARTVLIHDGARPFLSAELVGRMIEAGAAGPAIAATRVIDTIKEADAAGYVRSTPPREHLWQAQTPQAFPRGTIVDVHRRAAADGVRATDDAALCEAYGARVRIVEGDPRNVKITRAIDLPVAEALARGLPRPVYP